MCVNAGFIASDWAWLHGPVLGHRRLGLGLGDRWRKLSRNVKTGRIMGVACLEFRGENFRAWLKNRSIFRSWIAMFQSPLFQSP